MKIYDISWPISEAMAEYKDAKIVKVVPTRSLENDGACQWEITLSDHTGTHVDAPAHFLPTGSTADQLDLAKLIGACRVLDLTKCLERITMHDLQPFSIKPDEIILLKTTNSFRDPNDRFNYSFVYVDQDAAAYLAAQPIKTIGVDYLGIERNQPHHHTHKALMKADIPIIEGLRLGTIEPGDYTLYCLPLYLQGTSGAPARAVLMQC